MSKRFTKENLSLNYFIKRNQTLNLYRQFLRAINKLSDNDLKADLKDQVQIDFKRHKDLKDNVVINSLLIDARRNLNRVKDLAINNTSNDSNSWINSSDENDQKGRVGSGWPWSK